MRRLRGLVARGWTAVADTAFRAWRESSITAATILIPTRGWRGEVIERAKPALARELAKRLRTKLGRRHSVRVVRESASGFWIHADDDEPIEELTDLVYAEGDAVVADYLRGQLDR